MILYFVLVGFVAGGIGAAVVLTVGGGIWLAILAYSLVGALGVVVSAVVLAFMPSFPRPRPRGGLPVDARRVRVQAHAPRR